jgi:Eukaryotic-type carbonic anhydrase
LVSFVTYPIIIQFLIASQLSRFRSLEDEEGQTLSHNFRPVQPIGDRVVWFTSGKFEEDEEHEIHDAIHGKKKKAKNSAHLNHSQLITVILSASLVSIFSSQSSR